MTCNHNLSMLVGTADGIKCKGCGTVFKTMPTQAVILEKPKKDPAQEVKEPVKKAPATKKAPAKKGAK